MLTFVVAAVPGRVTPSGASQIADSVDAYPGQFEPIAPTLVLDTSTGFGVPGSVAGDVGPGGSISPISVLGVGAIPTTGVEAVFVNIEEVSSTGPGFVSVYASDIPNTDRAVVSFNGGGADNGSSIVNLSLASSEYPSTFAVTNNGGSSASLEAFVDGYFTDGTNGAGDPYIGVTSTSIVDTRDGTGVAEGKVGANGSITFSVLAASESAGVPQSDIGAVNLEFGALDETAGGALSVTSALGPDPFPELNYESGVKTRVSDFVVPSSSGTITMTNLGSSPVDIQVIFDGVFISPNSTEAGSLFVPMDPTVLCDTRSSCQSNPTRAVPANQSITVQETGIAGIPLGVPEIADEIDAVDGTATGYLTVNPTGITDPSDTSVVNFTEGVGGENVTFSNTVVTEASTSGDVTITNNSSGTVEVVVLAEGYWLGASVPGVPQDVDSTYDGTNANVVWSPPGDDGGANISSYVVEDVNSGASTTVSGLTFAASVPAAAGDSITVMAGNALGDGSGSSPLSVNGITDNGNALAALSAETDAQSALDAPETTPMTPCASEPSPPPNGTVSGIVEYGSTALDGSGGQPVVNDNVDVSLDDSDIGGSLPLLGSVLTDANGCFWYTLSTANLDPDTAAEVTELSATTGSVNLMFTSNGTLTTPANGSVQVTGTVEVPVTVNGDNSSDVEPAVSLLPVDGGALPTVGGGTVSPDIKGISPQSFRAQAELQRWTQQERTLSLVRRIEGPSFSASSDVTRYHYTATRAFDPYDVLGVNLQSAPVNVSGLRAGLKLTTNKARLLRLRAIERKLHRKVSLSVSPDYVVPAPGGGDCDYDIFAAENVNIPSNSQCVEICQSKPQSETSPSTYGWVPGGQSNADVNGESGSIEKETDKSFSADVSAEVSVGALSGGGGHTTDGTASHVMSFSRYYNSNKPKGSNTDIYPDTAYQVVLPARWDTQATVVGCVSFRVGQLNGSLAGSNTGDDPHYVPQSWDPSLDPQLSYQSTWRAGSPGYGEGLWDVGDYCPYNYDLTGEAAGIPIYGQDTPCNLGWIVAKTMEAYHTEWPSIFPSVPSYATFEATPEDTAWASKWLTNNALESALTNNYKTAMHILSVFPPNCGTVTTQQPNGDCQDIKIRGQYNQPYRIVPIPTLAAGSACPGGEKVCGNGQWWENKAACQLYDEGTAEPPGTEDGNGNTTTKSTAWSLEVGLSLSFPDIPFFSAKITTTWTWTQSNESGYYVDWPQEGDMYFSNLPGNASTHTYLNPLSINTPELFAGPYYPLDSNGNETFFPPGQTRASVCQNYPGSPS